jgi:hypothetical protein
MPSAIGMTDLGANGFSFIDQIARGAQTVDQLEWVVAHNIAHELMLAFGVPETHDKTGNFIDAENANWSMMTSPSAVFSQGAIQDLLSRNFLATANSPSVPGAQLLGPAAVPEPATIGSWMLAVSMVAWASRRRMRDAAKRVR